MFDYIEHSHKQYDIELAPFTSFGVGGKAFALLHAKNQQIKDIIKECDRHKLDYFVLGFGCNVLVADSGFDGVVIKLIGKDISIVDDTICADAGIGLGSIVSLAQVVGLSGLEWACGLPSSVGGAVYGNAGAFGKCIADAIIGCKVIDKSGIISTHSKEQCEFEYRSSVFKREKLIVLNVCFGLQKLDCDTIKANTKKYAKSRKNPKGHSAGSVFKNPVGHSAGALIDTAGLKGMRVGGAYISKQHANFIMNDGTASADDIYTVIQLVKAKVLAKHDIMLEEELQLIGYKHADIV